MRKIMHRTLVWLMIAAMMFTFLPVSALADSSPAQNASETEQATAAEPSEKITQNDSKTEFAKDIDPAETGNTDTEESENSAETGNSDTEESENSAETGNTDTEESEDSAETGNTDAEENENLAETENADAAEDGSGKNSILDSILSGGNPTVASVLPDTKAYHTYVFTTDDGTFATQIIGDGETLNDPGTPEVAAGKKFLGWYANGTKLTFGAKEVTETKTITVTAKFSDVYYAYFMTLEDTVYKTLEATSENDFTVTAPKDYVPTGKRVKNWKYGEAENTVLPGKDIKLSADTVFTAEAVDCVWVTYDTDGAGSVASQYADVNSTVTLSTEKPTRTGYTFGGWTLEKGGTSAVTSIESIQSDTTVYAIWNAAEVGFTVVYWGENADDENYSPLATASKTAKTGAGVSSADYPTLPSGTTDSSYFSFNAEKTENVTILADGSSVLNVYFKRNTYTLTFVGSGSTTYSCGKEEHTHTTSRRNGCYDKNGNLTCGKEEHTHTSECISSSDGNTYTITAKYGARISDEFKNDFFSVTYSGRAWSCTDSSKYSYALQTLDRMPGFDATFKLYNQSSTTKKTIYYYVQNVGTTAPSRWPSSADGFTLLKSVDTYFNFATYDEEYHDILGFTRYGASEAGFNNNEKNFSNNALNLYYKRNSYTLTLNNYGTETDNTVQYGASLSSYGSAPATHPAGKTEFKGWYTVEPDQVTDSTKAFDFANSTMPAGNLVLYAKWEEPTITVQMTVTITSGDKTWKVTFPAGSSIGEQDEYTELLQEIGNEGYTLLRWVDSKGNVFNINEKLYSDTTLTGVLAKGTYTVTYDSGAKDENRYEADTEAKVLPFTGTVPDGKVFLGWTTVKGAAEAEYYPGGALKIENADITLYAVFGDKEDKVSLTYKPNGGDGADKTFSEILNNSQVTLEGGIYTRTGYELIGWSTSADAAKAEFALGGTARVDKEGDNVLYAVWQAKTDVSYTVHYYKEGTADSVAEDKVVTGQTFDSTVEESAVAVTGYTAVAPTQQTLKLDAYNKEITFYYTVNSYSYTVNYYWINTTEPVHTAKTTEAAFGTQVTESPETADGCTAVSDDSKSITITTGTNEIIFYYYRNVTLTANSAEYPYNGKEQSVSGYTVNAESVEFEGITAGIGGTAAGTYTAIFNKSPVGKLDRTGKYIVTEAVNGTLTIKPVDTQVTVTIKGNTASAEYDGEEKTAEGYTVTIDNALYTTADFSFSGTKTVTKTDAGEYAMGLEEKQFTNTNVNFTNVKFDVTDGSLTITKRPVTFTGETKQLTYTGKTQKLTGISDEGLVKNHTYENLSYSASGKNVGTYGGTFSGTVVIRDASGTDVTKNYNVTKTPGTLTITNAQFNVTFTGESKNVTYNGAKQKINGITAEGLLEGHTYTMTYSAEGTDADEYTGIFGELHIYDGAVDVTANYAVTCNPGTLTIEKKDVTFTGASDSKAYNGETQELTDISEEGLVKGHTYESLSYSASGKDAGTYGGAFSGTVVIKDASGTDVTKNYNVTETPGTLTINPVSGKVTVKITGHTVTDTYDGTAKTVSGYDVSISNKLYTESDFTFSGTKTVTKTDAGEYAMGLSKEQFENKSGNFSDVEFVVTDGSLSISQKSVTITAASAKREYDGTPLTNGKYTSTELASTDHFDSVTVTGSITNVGKTANTASDAVIRNAGGQDVTANYAVTYVPGELEITQNTKAVSVTANSNSWMYDGAEHSDGGYTVTYDGKDYTAAAGESVTLPTGDKVTAVIPSSVKNVEDTKEGNNTLTVTVDNAAQYKSISTTPGTLTVTERHVTLTSADDTKTYDRTPLTNDTVTVSGDGFAEGEKPTITVTGSQTNVGESKNTFGYELAAGSLASNYVISTVFGTLKVTGDKIIPAKTTPDVQSNYQLGDKIPFTITVENVSDETVTDITVVDSNAIITVGEGYTVADEHTAVIASIDSNKTVSVNAEHTVTSNDILAGTVGNTATVSWGGTTRTVSADSHDIQAPIVSLELVKTSDTNGEKLKLDDVVTYTVSVTNTGNVPYEVSLTDEMTGVGVYNKELAVGETYTDTFGTHTVTEEDIQTGSVTNTVTAAVAPVSYKAYEDGSVVTKKTEELIGEASVTDQTVGTDKDLTIVKKSTDSSKRYALGETITYTISVTNTGNQTLNNIVLTDTLDAAKITAGTGYTAAGNTATIVSLKPGASVTVNAEYTVTSDDIKAGQVENSVTVTTDDEPTSKHITPATDSTAALNTALSVTKKSDKTGEVKLGETITYTITVKNEGNVPYTNVQVVDELTKLSETIKELAVGETKEFTTSYTVTSDDVLKGSIVNAVTAKGDSIPDPDDPTNPKTPEDTDEVTDETADVDAKLTVTKTSDKTGEVKLGEVITYTITVKNDGNVPYTNVAVDDELVNLHETIEELKVGETKTYTRTYTVTSDDILKGSIVNTVTAKGDDITDPKNPDTPKTPEGEDEITDETVDVDVTLTVTKTSDKTENVKLGEAINYTVTVKNDGNVPYYNVKVSDPLTGFNTTINELKVGETKTFTTSYTAASKDILAGSIVNTVTAKADKVNGEEPAGSATVTDETADVNAKLTVTKTSDKTGEVKLGEVITYTITVTNEGNVPYYNVKVVDELTKLSETIQELAVGETKEFTTSYTVTSDDILAGSIVNTVTAKGDEIIDPKNPDAPKTPEGEGKTENETEDVNAKLTVTKVSDKTENVKLGEKITYTITVKNEGNVPYYNVKVVDELTKLEKTIGELKVGETKEFTTSHTVTSDDILAGEVVNAVTAKGDDITDPKNPDTPKTPEGEDEITDKTDDVNAGLGVAKKSDKTGEVKLGETITYTLTVKNEGNVPYYNVKVSDPLTGFNTTIDELKVGETKTFTTSYTATSKDILAGEIVNTVTAKADKVNGEEPAGSATVTDETADVNAKLTVTKTSDKTGEVKLGETITYTITVKNEGNVPYYNVKVVDELTKLGETIQELAVGETKEFTTSYTVTEDDILAGRILNTATAKGDEIIDPKNPDTPKTPEGGDETENKTEKVKAELTMEKTVVEPKEFYKLSEKITYTITVTNTGNVPCTNVTVEDKLVDLHETIAELAVGGTNTYTKTYIVQESDLGSGNYGKVANTATVKGEAPDPTNPDVVKPADPTDTDTVEVKTSIRIVITAKNASYTYDGEEHGGNGYDAAGLKSGHKLTVTIEGSRTNVGNYEKVLVPKDAKIVSGDKDVTEHYEITYVPGDLAINHAPIAKYVTVTPNDTEKVYDGESIAAKSAAAEDKNGGELKIEYSTDGQNWTEDPGTFTATDVKDSTTVQIRVSGNNYDGYVTAEQKLTVTPRPVTITAENVTVTYDGKVHGAEGYTVSNLVDTQKIASVKSDFTAKDADTYTDKLVLRDAVIEDAGGNKVTDNYTITYAPGTLTIKPYTGQITVTITGSDGVFRYDGKNHTVSGYKVEATVPFYTKDEIVFTGNAELTKARPGDYEMGLKTEEFSDRGVNFTNVKFVVRDGGMRIYTTRYYIAWMFDTDQLIDSGESDKLFTAETGYIRNQDISLVLHSGNVVADSASEEQWDVFNNGLQGIRDSEEKTVLMVAGEKETDKSSLFMQQTDWDSFEDEDIYEGGKGYAYRFCIGERSMIFVGLNADAMTEEAFAWAKERFDSAPDASGILMVHTYLLEDMKAGQKIAESAEKLEETVVKACPNVRLVLSSDGGYESHYEFTYGEHKVIAINSDLEAAAKAGYFTLLTYNEDLNLLSVTNLCPYTYDFVYKDKQAEKECYVFSDVF